MSQVPQLLDEIIGQIFVYLGPKSLGFFQYKSLDSKTLRTCCLVSRQFAFWARHILYKRIHLGTPTQVSHYIALCRAHSDMAIHIKTLEVTMIEEYWHEGKSTTRDGFNDLAALLDLLARDGSVDRCHFRFIKPWDRLNTNLQISILRFLLSHTFETVELCGICICFLPLWFVPFPWITKRFYMSKISLAVGEEDGNTFLSCPEWEKDRKQISSKKEKGNQGKRVLDKELQETYDGIIDHFRRDGVTHPERVKLESFWVPADTIGMFRSLLSRPTTGACITKLRELQFFDVNDDNIPDVFRVVEGCKDTLESLRFFNLEVKTATSSHLSLLTSVGLPRLRTLSIMTNIEPSGKRTKSMAWYLLHAKKNGQLRFKTLNLIFSDPTSYDAPLSFAGSIGNTILIRTLFDTFKLFKFEKLLYDTLTPGPVPDAGKVKLWFMMAQSPGPMEDILIEEGIQKEFPNLFEEKRIDWMVGDGDELLNLTDALSICPEGPAETRHHVSSQEEEKDPNNFKESFARPLLNEVRQQFGFD